MFFNIDTRSPIVSKFLSFSLSKDSKSLMLLPLLLLLMILLVWRLPTLVYPPRAWPLGDGILTTVYLCLLFLVVRSIQFLFYFCGVSEAKCVFSLFSSCVVVKRSSVGDFFIQRKSKNNLFLKKSLYEFVTAAASLHSFLQTSLFYSRARAHAHETRNTKQTHA